MITAKNYAAQCERGLRDYIASAPTQFHADAVSVESLFVSKIKPAVHFALIDGGKIFDDQLKGIRHIEVRLPFPSITVEFLDHFRCKHLIYATEVQSHTMADLVEHNRGEALFKSSEYAIVVFSARCHAKHLHWYPVPVGIGFPGHWDNGLQEGDNAIQGLSLSLCKDFVDASIESGKETLENLEANAAYGVKAIMELCEALTCSNVSSVRRDPVGPKVNARRIKDGKLPLYETRVLTIQSASGTQHSGGASSDVDRNGPRQHLRRGHIRRLPPDHTTKIWVNSCTVGSGPGRIEKSYAVV